MDDVQDLQALAKIKSEVEDSQLKISFSSQCNKAQSFLLNRLRKEAERQKQECKNINRSNFLLLAEIKNNELEIQRTLPLFDLTKESRLLSRQLNKIEVCVTSFRRYCRASVGTVNEGFHNCKYFWKRFSFRNPYGIGLDDENTLMYSKIISRGEAARGSLLNAHETIRSANIELQKELLLAKERRTETLTRMNSGKQKYEELWLQCKSRYEHIPHVQAWLTAKNQTKIFKDKIGALENKIKQMKEEIKIKKEHKFEMDKKNIIKLAEFMVHTRPKMLKNIEDKYMNIKELQAYIDDNVIKQGNKENSHINCNIPKDTFKNVNQAGETIDINTMEAERQEMCNITNDNGVMMPKLTMNNVDFDVFSTKLNKIKMIDVTYGNSGKNTEFKYPVTNKQQHQSDSSFSVSMFFEKPKTGVTNNEQTITNDYSKRKLIHILEDVTLNKNDVYDIVTAVQPKQLHEVHMIQGKKTRDENTAFDAIKDTNTIEDEKIEEIDLTKSNEKNILVPPSQFLDFSQQQVEVMVHISADETPQFHSSQNQENKKKVSFDLPIQGIEETHNGEACQMEDEKEANSNITSQVHMTSVSDESFTNMKDMILKNNNLYVSPPFVYAKNELQTKNYNNRKVVTSKFFTESHNDIETDKQTNNDNGTDNNKENNMVIDKEVESDINIENKKPETMEMEVNEENVNQMSFPNRNKHITGFLFNHGTQGIPDSLNVSIGTTGLEDCDADFPHCVDSSLLLSPKAHSSYQLETQPSEVTSQEVPNFISGLRKTGLSFFNKFTGPKADSEEQEQNNFIFKFGGDEKKTRNGLFSMFR